ncbi:MAG TPA: hypothetical protein VGP73_05800 [Thermoanaerobaculia bacterium]
MHHAQPPWFYLTTLPVDLLPWTGLVIGGLVLAWRERRDPRMRLVSSLVAQSMVFPAVNSIKSVRRLATEIGRETAGYQAAGGKVLELGLRNEPRAVAFYSNGVYPVDLPGPEELERTVAGAAPVYAILDEESLAALPAVTRDRLRVVSTTRMSDSEILFVRSGPPPPGR